MSSVKDEATKYKTIGNEYANNGMFKEAEEQYDKALTIDKTHEVPYLNLNCGRVCLSQNKLEKAVDMLKKAVELDPNDVEGYFYLGEAYMRKNAPIDAFATYSSGLEKDATCAMLYFARAQARYAIWKPALMSYTVNQMRESKSTEVKDNDLLDLAGKIIGDFKAALENGIAEADKMVTCENIAITYSQINEYGNAIWYYEKCVELDGKYAEAYQGLGDAHYSLYLRSSLPENNLERRIEHLKSAKENIEKAVKLYHEKLDLTPEQNKLLGSAMEKLDSMRHDFRKNGITY